MDLTEMGRAAVAAKYEVQKMTAEDKNASLKAVAEGCSVIRPLFLPPMHGMWNERSGAACIREWWTG